MTKKLFWLNAWKRTYHPFSAIYLLLNETLKLKDLKIISNELDRYKFTVSWY